MAAITDECFGIGKDNIEMESAKGAKFKIKGHTVEAVLAEVRPLLSRFGVRMRPSLVEKAYSGNRCDVVVDFTFINLDDRADTETVRWAGSGTDNSDKGFSKAGTNALKEMLKKTFLITDRDDAKEEEDKVEHVTESAASKAEVEKAKEAARANLEKWATAARAAFISAATLDDVKALEREHKDQLTSSEMPAATRAFFAQLIADRKEELA